MDLCFYLSFFSFFTQQIALLNHFSQGLTTPERPDVGKVFMALMMSRPCMSLEGGAGGVIARYANTVRKGASSEFGMDFFNGYELVSLCLAIKS